ncbi:hypothetical protein D9758_005442 [Tetrapyrgos nigripes]|uniref:Uncharacterized protein n=1 Tax=Tetrapyrgos nigripes TaxID=182062 RepID=A0A8H5GHR7_9AGAR|nr:hypothetical protein D9758_005442 [Tetrapyrgos nigripes]
MKLTKPRMPASPESPRRKTLFSSAESRSKTMLYALSEPSSSTNLTATPPRPALDFDRVTTTAISSSTSTSLSPSYIPSIPSNFNPRSRVEQYWAARALSAETLLTAKTEHHIEVKNLTYEGDFRRAQEVAELTRMHNEKLARLERLIMILLGFIAIFFGAIFVAYVNASSSSLRAASSHRPWTHFTIPILSPFASVVEQEVSVVGTRTITTGIIIFACLAYLMFRYWLTKSQLSSR